MIYLIVIYNIIIILLFGFHSQKLFDKSMRYSMVNPYIIYLILNLFITVDYLFLYGSEDENNYGYEIQVIFNNAEIIKSYMIYSLLFTCINIGMLIGMKRKNIGRKLPISYHKLEGRIIKIMFILLTILGFFVTYTGSYFYNVTRQITFADNKWIVYTYLFYLPMYIILIGKVKLTKIELGASTVFAIIILYSSGTRTHLMYVALALCYLYCSKGRKISMVNLILIIPIVAYYLLFVKYLKRTTVSYIDFGDYLNNISNINVEFFNSGEVAIAEAITVIISDFGKFNVNVYDSILSAILFPVPRSIFIDKPYGAAKSFTEYVSPTRLELFKSQICTSGYGDMIMHFGVYGAIIGSLIVGYLISLLIVHFIVKNKRYNVVNISIITWGIFVFTRSGFLDLAVKVWPYIIITLIIYIFKQITLKINHKSKFSNGSI